MKKLNNNEIKLEVYDKKEISETVSKTINFESKKQKIKNNFILNNNNMNEEENSNTNDSSNKNNKKEISKLYIREISIY